MTQRFKRSEDQKIKALYMHIIGNIIINVHLSSVKNPYQQIDHKNGGSLSIIESLKMKTHNTTIISSLLSLKFLCNISNLYLIFTGNNHFFYQGNLINTIQFISDVDTFQVNLLSKSKNLTLTIE